MSILQKIKWNFLAKIRPSYFIYSRLKENNEELYKKSGVQDVDRLLSKDEFLHSLILYSNSVILEIGCGNGRMTEFIAQQFKRVYAVDISSEMISLARNRLSHVNNIVWVESDGEKYLIDDNVIDLVFSYIVFQHFFNKKWLKII
jgi:ubiquinone/menaquinone biosynthesis C-methylase UbiE